MKKRLALLLSFVLVFALTASPCGVLADEAAAPATTANTATDTTAAVSASTEFTDVPSSNKFSEAIHTLAGMGIILGDSGTNTFRPESGITRAEFSVIVARIKGMGALNINVTSYPFTDVTPATCEDWKIKATKIAYDLGVVSGMGDGTFEPDSPVTYEQAVKMLVCLLGYKPMADNNGGWPGGYIVAGSNIGLTNKAIAIQTEPAERQIIAQLVFNSLKIPIMGTSTISGSSDTLIDSTLKYTEGKGIVTAAGSSSLNGENLAVKDGQIQINYDKIFNVGSTNASSYFGKEVSFFYSEDDDEYTLQTVKLTSSNKESVFATDDICNMSESEIRIYTDEDKQDYDSYTVDSDVHLMYNGQAAPYKDTTAGYINNTYKPYDGSLTLIDNDGDNKTDVIIIKDAKPFVISAIDSTNSTLYNVYDSTETLNLQTGSSKSVSIKKNGTEISFSGLAKDNVLLVSKSLNTTGKKYITVDVVTNTVSGKISSFSSDDREVTINSKAYEISDICWNLYSSRFTIDNTVTLYLDSQSRVVYVSSNTTATKTNYTYGYIEGAGTKSGGVGTNAAQLQIFTQNGTMSTYSVSTKVKINGTQCTTPEEALAALNVSARTDINKDTGAVVNNYSQLIKYTLNSSNEISAILTSVAPGDSVTVANNLIVNSGTKTGTYKSGTKMMGTVATGTNTKFFFVPSNRASDDDYAIGKNTNVTNLRSYSFESFDIENGIAGVVVVYGDTGVEVYDITTPMVVVKQIGEISTENGSANKLTCMLGSSEKTYTTKSLTELSGIKNGDVIKIKLNKDGLIEEVMRLYSPADNFLYTYSNNSTRLAATNSIDIRSAVSTGPLEGDFVILYGTVYQKFDERMFVSLEDIQVDSEGKATLDNENLIPITFDSTTAYYKYSKSKNEITTGVAADILSFESTMKGASNVYVYSIDTIPKFVLITID